MPTGIYKRTDETKRILSLAHKGIVAWNKGIPCSKETKEKIKLANKGKKRTNEQKKQQSERIKKQWVLGLRTGVFSEEAKIKMSESQKRNPNRYWLGKTGEKHTAWKGGLEFRKKGDTRNDSAYPEWRKQVWVRDNYKCKMANTDCCGKIEAHHILRWRDYPELRYNVNNGITLCHFHHPFKRKEEDLLSPYFQSLIANKVNEKIE